MRVLWVSLVKFPPLCDLLNEVKPFNCGWMYSSAKALLYCNSNINLGVAIPVNNVNEVKHYLIDGIDYFLIPVKKITTYNKQVIYDCKYVLETFKPQLVHIHGTEFSLATAMACAVNNSIPIIANIQGLASGIIRYSDGGLSFWDKFVNITPLDFFRGTFLMSIKNKFKRRSQNEIELIKKLTHVIGRTLWDEAHCKSINPKLKYYFLNETLRDVFYEEIKWNEALCERYSIFVSNSNEPLKGAHMIIKALPYVLEKYPTAQLKIVGHNVLSNKFSDLIRMTGYNLYLRKLIKSLKLENNIVFLGKLNEQEMRDAFLSSNIYVLPSSIENSSNSLCEAQILGVPAITSLSGGAMSLVEYEKTGFYYRYEEIEMLSFLIKTLFEHKTLKAISENEISVAMKRHDKKYNALELNNIYKKILHDDK